MVVVVVVVVVTGVWMAARIHTLRPDRLRQTSTVFFFLMMTVTRAPSLALAQDCPMETAFADAVGIAVQIKMALRAMKTFFTAVRLVSKN